MNRSESRILKGGVLNVVKAGHRDILRHSQAMIQHSADCADGGDIVERKKRRELIILGQQRPGQVISRFGRRSISLELGDQLGIDLKPELSRGMPSRVPASGSENAEGGSLQPRKARSD